MIFLIGTTIKNAGSKEAFRKSILISAAVCRFCFKNDEAISDYFIPRC
jgi:hypothetical protein